MKLTGELKKQVEKAKTKEEVKDTIEKAGMLLDDDELENVSGGWYTPDVFVTRDDPHCLRCMYGEKTSETDRVTCLRRYEGCKYTPIE